LGKRGNVPKDFQAHPILDELLYLFPRKLFQCGKKKVELLFGPVPILRGEGEDGEIREKFFLGNKAGDALHRLCALAMPFGAGKAPGLGPPAVPVHDEGHVLGKRPGAHLPK